jgi:hypothetical protein
LFVVFLVDHSACLLFCLRVSLLYFTCFLVFFHVSFVQSTLFSSCFFCLCFCLQVNFSFFCLLVDLSSCLLPVNLCLLMLIICRFVCFSSLFLFWLFIILIVVSLEFQI